MYKNYFVAYLAFILCASCFSDDDIEQPMVSTQLLIGSWTNIEACSGTNDGIVFATTTFTATTVDNTGDCSQEALCGNQLSGNYTIMGNELIYNNIAIQTIAYQDQIICVADVDGTVDMVYDITELTNVNLVIAAYKLNDDGDRIFQGSTIYTRD